MPTRTMLIPVPLDMEWDDIEADVEGVVRSELGSCPLSMDLDGVMTEGVVEGLGFSFDISEHDCKVFRVSIEEPDVESA